MKHLKYVITETGKIYFGYVEFHDVIRTGYMIKDRIVGGGFFSIDKENKWKYNTPINKDKDVTNKYRGVFFV